MDPHHHQYSQQQQQQEENGSSTNNGSSSCVGGVGSGSKVGFLCRQSSTRWIPTSDQIRILRDLYYNNGIRSPSNEQIQRISARLRQYGKIEGKNVFYWFQNHKARERQKKRLTVDVPNSNAAAASANYCTGNNTKCNNSSTNTPVMSPAGVTTPCSSSGYYGVGQIGSSGYSDPVFTERKFRDYYCMPGAGDVPAGNESSAGLLGFEAACETTPWMVHHYTSEHEAIPATREIETLPLFPVNAAAGGDGYKLPTPSKDGYSSMNCYLQVPFYSCSGQQQQQQPEELYNVHCNGSSAGAVAASLELSLNSYYYAPPGST